MDSSVSPKDEIWFPRVCHHISNAVYLFEWTAPCRNPPHATRITYINVKVQFPCPLRKGIWGEQLNLHSFLTSALYGGQWLTSRPGRTAPRKEPWYQLNRTLVGPHIRYGRFGENSLVRTGIRTPDRQAPSLVATLSTLPFSCITEIPAESTLYLKQIQSSHSVGFTLQFIHPLVTRKQKIYTGFNFCDTFHHEDGGRTFFQN